jgi:5-methylcytosine-specific restriction enzyme subunit McrC
MNDNYSSINEFESSKDRFESLDLEFIHKEINHNKDNLKLKILYNNKIQAKNYVGIVNLPSGKTIEIKPKVKWKSIIKILCYINNFKSDDFDETNFEEGNYFMDLIGFLFLNYLDNIRNKGFIKKYVKKEENINFLRGKILFQKHLVSNINNKKIYCSYHDLSLDNFENQVLLNALKIILFNVKNEDLFFKLKNYENSFELNGISYVNVKKNLSFFRINNIINRLNQHYESALKLSQLIINNSFINDFSYGNSLASGILFDMNKIFESFLEIIIKEILSDYEVIGQKSCKALINPSVNIKPDIIILKEDCPKFIIDAKYKILNSTPSNADFYQMLAYSGHYDTDVMLIYPFVQNLKTKEFDILEKNHKIFIETIDLNKSIGEIKEELKEKLLTKNKLFAFNLLLSSSEQEEY